MPTLARSTGSIAAMKAPIYQYIFMQTGSTEIIRIVVHWAYQSAVSVAQLEVSFCDLSCGRVLLIKRQRPPGISAFEDFRTALLIAGSPWPCSDRNESDKANPQRCLRRRLI